MTKTLFSRDAFGAELDSIIEHAFIVEAKKAVQHRPCTGRFIDWLFHDEGQVSEEYCPEFSASVLKTFVDLPDDRDNMMKAEKWLEAGHSFAASVACDNIKHPICMPDYEKVKQKAHKMERLKFIKMAEKAMVEAKEYVNTLLKAKRPADQSTFQQKSTYSHST